MILTFVGRLCQGIKYVIYFSQTILSGYANDLDGQLRGDFVKVWPAIAKVRNRTQSPMHGQIIQVEVRYDHRLMCFQIRGHHAEQLRGEEFREQQEMAVVLLRNGYDLKLSIRNL